MKKSSLDTTRKTFQKIHLVSGKGGVGKSFLAASLALQKAQSLAENLARLNSNSTSSNTTQNAPILLAEMIDQSFYADYFETEPLKLIGRPFDKLNSYLYMAHWTGAECLKEYAKYLLKIDSLVTLFFENPVSKALIEVSPGLQELALLGKATSLPRAHGPPLNYSEIVFDSFATGHFLTLLRSPKALGEVIQFGPMGEQTRDIHNWITQKDFCEIHLVTLPEELPVTETLELADTLQTEFGLTPNIYVNKVIQVPEVEFHKLSQVQPPLNHQLIKNHLQQQILQQQKWIQVLKQKYKTVVELPLFTQLQAIELVQEAAKKLQELHQQQHLQNQNSRPDHS